MKAKKRVILTAKIQNLQHLKNVVESLISQTDSLFIYLQGFEDAPHFIKHHLKKNKIEYFVDTAEILQNINGLWFVNNDEYFCILCNDNHIYPNNFVTMVADTFNNIKSKNIILGYQGETFSKNGRKNKLNKKINKFDYWDEVSKLKQTHLLDINFLAMFNNTINNTFLKNACKYQSHLNEYLAIEAKNENITLYSSNCWEIINESTINLAKKIEKPNEFIKRKEKKDLMVNNLIAAASPWQKKQYLHLQIISKIKGLLKK